MPRLPGSGTSSASTGSAAASATETGDGRASGAGAGAGAGRRLTMPPACSTTCSTMGATRLLASFVEQVDGELAEHPGHGDLLVALLDELRDDLLEVHHEAQG